MMSYSNKLHNSSFQSNGGVNDGGSSGDDGDDGLAGDGQWDDGGKMRFLGDVGGDVASGGDGLFGGAQAALGHMSAGLGEP